MPDRDHLRDGSVGFHGYMSSRSDQAHHLALRSPSSNHDSLMLQDAHDPNHQFLSNLGLELLSSPTSSSSGFRTSSLLRSLTEPSAAAAKTSPGFLQQYQQQQTMNQAPAGSIREALQFTSSTPFWNPSAGGFASAAEGAASLLGTAAGPPSGQSTPANFGVKVRVYIVTVLLIFSVGWKLLVTFQSLHATQLCLITFNGLNVLRRCAVVPTDQS